MLLFYMNKWKPFWIWRQKHSICRLTNCIFVWFQQNCVWLRQCDRGEMSVSCMTETWVPEIEELSLVEVEDISWKDHEVKEPLSMQSLLNGIRRHTIFPSQMLWLTYIATSPNPPPKFSNCFHKHLLSI